MAHRCLPASAAGAGQQRNYGVFEKVLRWSNIQSPMSNVSRPGPEITLISSFPGHWTLFEYFEYALTWNLPGFPGGNPRPDLGHEHHRRRDLQHSRDDQQRQRGVALMSGAFQGFADHPA